MKNPPGEKSGTAGPGASAGRAPAPHAPETAAAPVDRPNALIVLDDSHHLESTVCGLSVFVRMVCALERAAGTVYILPLARFPAATLERLRSAVRRHPRPPKPQWVESSAAIDVHPGLLVMSGAAVVDPRAAHEAGAIEGARRAVAAFGGGSTAPCLWYVGGDRGPELVRWIRDPSRELSATLAAHQTDSIDLGGFFCRAIVDEASREDTERRIFDTARKDGDSWIARNVDRQLSLWITRRLIQLPLTPNHVTLLATAIGLFGVGLLALGTYLPQLVGSVLLVLSVIVDGCDGEVARLKYLESDFGRKLDFFLDNVVNVLAIFFVGAGHYWNGGGSTFYFWGSLANGGAALAAVFPVYFLFFRENKQAILSGTEKPTDAYRIGELVAGRDFVYLFVVLALFGRVYWFTQACLAGIGFFLLFVVYLLVSRATGVAEAKPLSDRSL